MEVLLPENISDITLEQYIKFAALGDIDGVKLEKRKIEIFTGISRRRLNQVKQKDYDDMLQQIDIALSQDSEFQNKFTMNGIEYGFIPNFDKITAGEWGDISKYNVETETLNRLMAILFRPITDEDNFGNYKIAKYNGTEEHAKVMLQTPMNIVNGALVFFYNLAKELQQAIHQYMEQGQRRVSEHQTSLKNGDGMQPFMN